jgi:predicted permease
MDWLRTFLSRCVALFHRKQLDRELDEELLSHIEFAVEENLRNGLSEEEARSVALRQFGGITQVKEAYRMQRELSFMDAIVQDLRFAARQMKRAPGFVVVAILTLALGIGANTAVFTLIHALMLTTLPVRDPGELVRLTLNVNVPEPDAHDAPLNLPIVEAIRKQSRSFHGIFAWCVYDFPFRDGTVNSGLHGAIVSGNAFESLGLQPAAGRLLTYGDDQAGGGPDGLVAVISYRMWVERYHANPSVIGRHIVVTDHNVTIIGVAPAGFEGVVVAQHPDIYLPLEFTAALYGRADKYNSARLWLDTFARLNPGVSHAQAAAEMNALFPSILDATLPPAMRHWPVIETARFEVKPASTGWGKLRLQYTEPLLLLQLMVATVLLICCANLSGLFLARASARQQEFAIRGALGAGRFRLMHQLFIECLMLALPGAWLGVGLAWMCGPWMVHMLGDPQAEVAISMRPNLPVLSVTLACAVLCALLFGMAPAWLASHTGSIEAKLRSSHPRASVSTGLRNFFVPFQLALSLTLLVIASLLGTTINRLLTESSGYRIDNVAFALTDFLRIPEKGNALVALYWRMAERLEESPGVQQVSVAAISPLMGNRWTDEFVAAEDAQRVRPVEASGNVIAAHYFSALGIPILAGRDFQNNKSDQSSCIVSETAARLYFPNSPALGKTLRRIIHFRRTGVDTFQDCQIVGVVQDTKYDSLRESAPPIVYMSLGAEEGGRGELTNGGAQLFFIIHAQNVEIAKSAYLKTLHEMAPTSPEIPPFPFARTMQVSVARERLLSVLSGFFALLGLLLSGIGIYGLVAWNVTRRTTEIGLRIALGATRPRVFSLVIGQVTLLLAMGVALGGVAAFFAGHAIRSFLFEIRPGDPIIFVLSTLLLTFIGLLAAALPARRAILIDPMRALKTE